ncbi:MAG: ribosome recycling factor [Nitrospinota bacterium]|nr:ribosome recycling factor [Nitrospinota bacterium]
MDKIMEEVNHKMDITIQHFAKELAGVRTGRASIGLLDGVLVDYYGNKSPLSQVATLSTPDALSIAIMPWDTSLLPVIEKAISASNLGLNPQNDGKLIRIPIPPLTEERRKELAKVVKKFAEETKVAVRNVRREGIEHVKKKEKAKELSEDLAKKATDKIQKLTDDHVAMVDRMASAKEKEILDR